MEEKKTTRKVEKMANPVKTLWWETYQLWDEVLHQVGLEVEAKVKAKAKFKIGPYELERRR
ncbi:hypothetical protein VMCG_10680 [Cytospora schulzeri]|uniref:Uncharacterized protein n=1 Tax=Cytospora schulzeri TaxID=448051 RepID=A0A423VAW8_9PEZI|nr:hypothetical protein VMCG_10680 [Valsa malicola]